MPVGEKIEVMAEVGQQDVLAEFVQGLAGIPRQPVVYDLFFRLHVTEINQLVLKHAQPFL
jgi:hypothetical protein